MLQPPHVSIDEVLEKGIWAPTSDPLNPKGKTPIMIHRFPKLTGPRFQEFYESVVRGVLTSDTELLYSISDQCQSLEDFQTNYNSTIGDKIQELLSLPESRRNIDIELNFQRFEELHRNIIGGIHILAYELFFASDEISNEHCRPQMREYVSEILFTSKYNRFQIISKFSPLAFEPELN